jgi:hypothetical protein
MEYVRLPLVLDVGNRQGEAARRTYDDVHAIATAHPRLPIVLWNCFYTDERLLVPLLDVCPNVRVGLARVFIPTFGIEQFTARYGPGRLIFGSNWPRQSPGPLLTYVLYADVPDVVKMAILGDTIHALIHDVRWPVRGFLADAKADGAGAPDDSAGGEAAGPTEEADQARRAADAESAPWLEAMAELEARARSPQRASDEEGE